jgi:predicted dehydrogenase
MMRMTRRCFLSGAAAGVAAPYVIGSGALGAAGRPAPSNRVTMGFIGIGGQGTGLLHSFVRSAQVLAVCDVDARRRQGAKDVVDQAYGDKGCAGYSDFRALLARPDIDTVCIATPDHNHVLPVILAAKAGKDIYCEKPLSRTVAEGRAMCDAVQRYARVFQHGTQQRSDQRFRHACELVRNGRLGKLRKVTLVVPGGRKSDSPPSQPVPDGLDYDMWLGPAPWAPYCPQRVQNGYWYHTYDYTVGFVSGWGVHHIDIVQWALDAELGGPTELEGVGDYPQDGLCDAAARWHMALTYADGLKVIFSDSSQDNPYAHSEWIRFEGSDGWVWVRRGEIQASPPSLLREKFGPHEVRLYDSRSHGGNLLDCVRSRRPTIAPIEIGHRSNTICLISDIAMRLGRKLKWDARSEQFVGDDQANRMLGRAMRAPWTL